MTLQEFPLDRVHDMWQPICNVAHCANGNPTMKSSRRSFLMGAAALIVSPYVEKRRGVEGGVLYVFQDGSVIPLYEPITLGNEYFRWNFRPAQAG